MANEFRRHVHGGFCFGIVQKGVRVINRGGTSTEIPEEGLFVINPGESHACKSLCGDHSYVTVCVEAENMKAIASQISEKACASPYFKDVLLHDLELSSEIRRFFSLVEMKSSVLETESLLLSFLSTLILRHGNGAPAPFRMGSQDAAIKRACEFMRMNYARDLSLKQLSREACLSPFYFQRLFIENTGVSPHDYLVQFRIKKARALLLEGHGIAGVALDTGFADQSHFTRSFKRVTGVTPGGYIRAIQPGFLANGVDAAPETLYEKIRR
ncbi:MAG: helix-turn-helix transcriptional regulator [Deltaproteobacteria bacterium]|nr:helix-turn-helix transcriptional regulator [Deltaproteobacteria bacterium]